MKVPDLEAMISQHEEGCLPTPRDWYWLRCHLPKWDSKSGRVYGRVYFTDLGVACIQAVQTADESRGVYPHQRGVLSPQQDARWQTMKARVIQELHSRKLIRSNAQSVRFDYIYDLVNSWSQGSEQQGCR